MQIIAYTFDIIGKVMVTYTVLGVHYRFRKEHRIDEKVFTEMKTEQTVGLVGIAFMIFGYVIHVLLEMNLIQ